MLYISIIAPYIGAELKMKLNLKQENMKILKRSLLAISMIFGTAVYAQDFDTYDSDMDGGLSADEFMERNNAGYNNWDTNTDGIIDDNEFSERAYGNFDRNRDTFIDETEWDDGINNGFGQQFGDVDYDVLDANRDGMLDTDEWDVGMNNNTWFDRYDSNEDGFIDNDEWNISTFDDWDVNDDDLIDETEFNDFDAFENW